MYLFIELSHSKLYAKQKLNIIYAKFVIDLHTHAASSKYARSLYDRTLFIYIHATTDFNNSN